MKELTDLIKLSMDMNMSHIPSALSMYPYLKHVFKHVKKTDNIVIGKPFGAQAYYKVWKDLQWISDYSNCADIVLKDNFDFVDFNSETIGHALGFACGVALADSSKVTYVNLSDGCLQSGDFYEALLFMCQHELNIFITIDENLDQCHGKTVDILDVSCVQGMLKRLPIEYSTPPKTKYNEYIEKYYNMSGPRILFFNNSLGTIWCNRLKAQGWHYKKILNDTDLEQCLAIARD